MTVAPVVVHGGAPPLLHHPSSSSSSSTKHNLLHHFSPILLNRSTRFHTINKLCVKPTSRSYLSLLKRRRFGLKCSLDSDIPNPLDPQDNEVYMDFITIAGLSALPQVMWSTFVPYVPNSILPGIISFVIAVVTVIMARIGKLPENATKFVGSISGWTATLLFMWMPVAQMWTNFLNPDNIRGLSAISMLLAMTGNGLLIPRALFVKDLM
nr:maltose excess protein 1-like, chloroplastic [Tanacetum cinerariifolium]